MPTEKQINSALDLGELANLVSFCARCPLAKSKTNDVPGVGDSKADVMFIGEAPGKQEDLEGEPFVGAAGKFFTEMIEGLGWKRSDVYVTNVLKHRPPKNRDPKANEIKACWPYLNKQIELIQPKLIVFLGRHALNQFFPELKISTVHGQIFIKEWNGSKQNFFALYHPMTARFGGMKEVLRADFNKIPKILEEVEVAIGAENIKPITDR
jgi:uracil-DNA glycosylase